MQSRDAYRVRLDLADLLLIHDPALHTIPLRSPVQLRQRGALGVGACNDQDAALNHRNAALHAIRPQRPTALHAILRLERAGLQIVAGVNHTAVPPALVSGRPRFLLEHDDACARPSEMQRGTRADRTRPDHDDVGIQFRWPAAMVGSGWPSMWSTILGRRG